jgi:hypothetical protein
MKPNTLKNMGAYNNSAGAAKFMPLSKQGMNTPRTQPGQSPTR